MHCRVSLRVFEAFYEKRHVYVWIAVIIDTSRDRNSNKNVYVYKGAVLLFYLFGMALDWWWSVAVGTIGVVITTVIGAILFAVKREPKLRIKGARVLITGGSTGIGLAMAKEFVRRGARVVITARREDVLQKAVEEINRDAKAESALLHAVSYAVMDVSNDASTRSGYEKALIAAGVDGSSATAAAFDIVVCCAGFSHPSRFLDCPPEVAKQMMDVNYFGCVNVARVALPGMTAQRHGRLVLVSSMAAAAPIAGFTTYSPTKAAVRAFAQALDMEYACLGVRTQVVNPPDVDTPGYEQENKVKSEECKRICAMGGASPFTSRAMAVACVEGIETFRFQVNLGFDGIMLGYGSACMEAPSHALDLAMQFMFGGIIRLVGAVYTKLHFGIVSDVRREEELKKK